MRKQIWSLTGLVAFGLATACPVHAQQSPPKPAANQQALNWAEKMFSQRNQDFGHVAKGADVRHSIIIKNIYEEDVQIGAVTSSCGCTSPSVTKNLLKSHEEAKLDLKVNTEAFQGQKNPTIAITMTFRDKSGQSRTTIVQIPVSVYIRPDVVLTPGNADFGTVAFGEAASRKLEIKYAGRQDWNIRDVRVGHESIKAVVKEVLRANGRVHYELQVDLAASTAMGSLQDQITLITDDPQSPEVAVLVMARVEPDIVITPSIYKLGNLDPGQSKEFTVVLKGKKPFVIQNVQCESERDCLEFKAPPTVPKAVHLVQFKLTAPQDVGKLAEKLKFTIMDRAEPITCVAEANVVGS